MIQNFRAYDLAIQLNRKLPSLELKGNLRDQLERAAQSVALNLAEGSGKRTSVDQRRFFSIAFGSIREVQAVFDLIQVEDKQLKDLIDHLAASVYKLVYRRL